MANVHSKDRAVRLLARGAVGAAVAVLAVGMAGTANADATPPQGVDGNVEVGASIVLSGLTPAFTLSGIPGATVAGLDAVAYNVATNNLAGYAVTVQSTSATMDGTAPNTDSIPIEALGARDGAGTAAYLAVAGPAATAGTTVHTQATRSAAGGDPLTTDFQVVIPFVNSDTYDATINYVAATL
jgi:hypothetical protein